MRRILFIAATILVPLAFGCQKVSPTIRALSSVPHPVSYGPATPRYFSGFSGGGAPLPSLSGNYMLNRSLDSYSAGFSTSTPGGTHVEDAPVVSDTQGTYPGVTP